MNFQVKKCTLAVASAVLMALLPVTGTALTNEQEQGFYGLRTLNNDVTAKSLETQPIDGFNYVFTAAFVTKGAWGYDNINEDDRFIKVMERAKQEDQLTTEGEHLYKAVKKLGPKITSVSFNELTLSGVNAINSLGANFAQSRKNLLTNHKMYDNNVDILFSYDGSEVSLKTGEQFVLGLIKSFVNDKIQIEYIQEEQTDLGYYESLEYKRWLITYPDTHRQLGQIKYGTGSNSKQKSNQTKNYVDNVLQRIFKRTFLNKIQHNSLILDTHVEGRDVVEALFDIYKFLPSINIQEADEFNKVLADIMTKEEKRLFSAIDNANMFIKYGPSVTGQNQTTEPGRRLFRDLNITLQDSRDNNDDQVKFYFIDPRSLLSLLTLLKGNELGEQINSNENYSYTEDVFKTSQLAPLNSIMIWDFYKNRDNKILVKINHNGKLLKLKEDCQEQIEPNSKTYDWEEITQCLE